nr:TIGR03545 family protein [uncultured Treponema sp.]
MKEEQKKIPFKKLPWMYKKTYTEKSLEKKLLKKLYIPADREFVAAQFSADEEDPAKLRIHRTEYDAKDFKRLKILSKQIKRQKGRINLVPLAAIAAVVVGVVLAVLMFKDPLAKRALTAGLQKITGAKVDIASVHVGILDASVTVRGLAAADKNAPMKNVFEAQKIQLDFNLTQLLKKRFVCQNLEVSGMAFGTDRKTSGELPASVKKGNDKDVGDSKIALLIKERQKDALEQSKKIVSSMFESLNPQKFLDNALKQLQTPAAVQKAQDMVAQIVAVWEKRPAELEAAVNGFRKSSEKVIGRDYQSIKDIAELKAVLQELNAAIKDSQKLVALTDSVVKDLQKDGKAVQLAAKEAFKAVRKDTDFVNGEINKIRSFTVADGKNIFAQTIKAAAYNVLGKYYPYAEKAFNAALNFNKGSKKAAKKQKTRQEVRRLPGRTIQYRADIYPSFLIQQMLANGTGFEGRINDISNDPDRWGKPVSFSAHFDESAFFESKRTHSGEGLINVGEKLNYPLLKLQYTGSGYNAAFNPSSALQALGASVLDIAGVPSFEGRAKIQAGIQAERDGHVGIDADFSFDEVRLTADSFEPDFISRIYNESLAAVKNMRFKIKAEFSQSDLNMDIATDADKVFLAALQTGINKELSAIKQKALKEAQAELEKYTGPLNEKLGDFGSIEKLVMNQKQAADMLQKKLEESKVEVMKRIEQTGMDTLRDAAGSTLKGLFGR